MAVHDSELEADTEYLAMLLWDFFGPKAPKSQAQMIAKPVAATEAQRKTYRQCAVDIVSSMQRER